MNANEITKQVLDFQKGAFAGWYDAMSTLQDQAASAVDSLLDQTSWIPEEGRQVISSWVSTCRKERDRYKVYLEESISGLEKCLAQDSKAAPAKPERPAAEEIKAASIQETKKATP